MSAVKTFAKISDFSNIKELTASSNGDYIVRHISSDSPDIVVHSAVRSEGLSIMMCTKGEATLPVNFHTVTLHSGTILFLTPNDVLEISGSKAHGIEGYFLFLTIDFLKTLNFDNNALNYSNIDLSSPPPVIQLNENHLQLFENYFKLLELNINVNIESSVYTRNISRSIVGALIYQYLSIYEKQQIEANNSQKRDAAIGRKQYYVKDFMSLLHQNFKQHRTVGFYADKLFISAKYLSLIIKEATGRTATEWIEHMVILEAKNLLRYSGLNIQQIAYDLNFHNQSAFGKYFKHLTGMSPSEFRKG